MMGFQRKVARPASKKKQVSDCSIELVKSNIDEIGVNIPILEEDIPTIYDWFQNKEIDMANALADGEIIDLRSRFRQRCSPIYTSSVTWPSGTFVP